MTDQNKQVKDSNSDRIEREYRARQEFLANCRREAHARMAACSN